MFGTSAGSPLSRRRILRPALGCALLLAGLPHSASATGAIVDLKFDEASGTTCGNTGGTLGNATLSPNTPSRSSNTPINGGTNALDFGNSEGNHYADLTAANTLTAVKNLKSFTIAGWVNSQSTQTNPGGGRIVSWYKWGQGGVDLAFRSDGSLGLGVDSWNDLAGGVTSSPAKIPVDAATPYNNWRFIAVTYDGTVSANNVKFYFGTNNVPAALDKTVSLNQGPTGGTIAQSLTIGNLPSDERSHATAVFRGLVDQVQIHGNTANATGVLSLDEIQALQQASSLVNVPGVVYEQWNGIGGNSLSALTSNSRFPLNPSLTKLQPNFEKLSSGDDSYGARLSGWVKAPSTGSYTFWIVGDDQAELRVSTDANPDNKRLVASVPSYNSGHDAWEQFTSQKSEPITLQANQHYYVEALLKDGSGGDYVRVGWQLQGSPAERPIPQSRLVTSPPDAVPFYPSVYPLYEPGTFVKKAAMGWHKQEGNDHFYIKTDETTALIAQNGTTIIPHRLHFGPTGNLGFRWYHDDERNFDYLAVGTGNEGTPQFDVMKVRRTPSGVDGVEFPMGLDFPSKEHVDGTSTWHENGVADEAGATFVRRGTHVTSTTDENGGLNAARVGFNQTLVSTEIGHEYTQGFSSVLAADELRMEDTRIDFIGATPTVSQGAMSANSTRFQTDATETNATTQETSLVSANRAEFNNFYNSTVPSHEYSLEETGVLDANEMRLTRIHSQADMTPFVTTSKVEADQVVFTQSAETGPTSNTDITSRMSANQVSVIETFNSTEISHEYSTETRSTLEKGELRIARTNYGPHQETSVEETLVHPDKIVTGTVVTKKWRVASAFPDYVFKKDYDLKSIEEVEAFARKNHHLPHFPSAETMAEKGVDLAEMNISLLRTMEEMTLHMASLKKDMRQQQEELAKLQKKLKAKQKGKAGIK